MHEAAHERVALGAHERDLGALVADEVREGEVGEGRGRDAVGEEADDGGGEGSRLSEGQRGAAGRVRRGELLGVLADQRLDEGQLVVEGAGADEGQVEGGVGVGGKVADA